MAYRRRQGQGMGRSSTFKEETEEHNYSSATSSSSTLAAQAIRASAAHRDSSHSSAYAHSASLKGAPSYDYTSMGSSNEAGSFWGVLARKAKAILDEDNNVPYQSEYINPNTINTRPQFLHSSRDFNNNINNIDQVEFSKKVDNPTLRKGIDAFTTKMNRIGDTIGNALEEGRTIVENKTADLILETRKLQTRRKGDEQQHLVSAGFHGPMQQSTQLQNLTSQEDQIKASRDVAMATAAKAKLLLRELKTVKADLAFAKQRSSQLEEENKVLRDARDKGVNPPEDDDMIRVQLETLLAEKARLAHENSVYARENRFLREIVEYHQLTMQDVVYLDEDIEEVTEVYPIPAVSRRLSVSPTSSSSPTSGSPVASLSRTTSTASRTSSVNTTTLSSLMSTQQLQLIPPSRDRDSNINNINNIPGRTVDPALPTSTNYYIKIIEE